MIKILKRIFIVLFLLIGLRLQSQDGSLDTSFNSSGTPPGTVTTSIGSNGADSYAVAIQADGKIVSVGTDSMNFALARYMINGSLDTSFNSTGTQPGTVTTQIGTSTSSFVNAVAIQADGKIIAAGSDNNNFVLARYIGIGASEGALDTSFNSTGTQPGTVTTPIGISTNSSANAVAIQVDGKIIAAGSDGTNFVVARYTSDGILDTTFGTNGITTTQIGGPTNRASINAVAIQTDGSIVAIGNDNSNFVLARYTTNGFLDNSFGNSGIVITSMPNSAAAFAGAIQANGKIIAAGVVYISGQQGFALARYNTDGSLDTTNFGTGGIVITIPTNDRFFSANAVTIQSDGKIVAAGRFTPSAMVGGPEQFVLARYTTNGSLDTSFGSDATGIVKTSIVVSGHNDTNSVISGLAIQSDGKIIADGAAGFVLNQDLFALARYNSQPALNPTVIIPPLIIPNTPITLSGTAQNESIITIIIDGQFTNFATTTPLNTSGSEMDTTGAWSLSIGTLSPGPHTIIASANYKAGNIILLSEPLQVCSPILSVNIMPQSQTICVGNAIDLSAQISGGTATRFVWSTPGRGTIITDTNILTLSNSTSSDTGNYTVIAIDSNDCPSLVSTSASVVVANAPASTIVASRNFIFSGKSTTITATPQGGTPPYKLVWSDGVTQNDVIGPVTRTITLYSTSQLSLVITDANGCKSATSTVTISVTPGSAITQAIFSKYCNCN